MMDRVSQGILIVEEAQWRLSGALDNGGVSENGEPQTRRSDGGGRWVCESEIVLTTDDQLRAYEALLLRWSLGYDIAVVPRIAGPLALGYSETGVLALVPYSDGSSFSDGTLFSSGTVSAYLVDDVVRGATTYRIRINGTTRGLRGAEPFTLFGPTYRERIHGTAAVLSAVADGDATIYQVMCAPPLRENYSAGTEVDYNDPRVVMRPDMSDPGVWPKYKDVFIGARLSVKFTETLRM